jgi:dolichol-phosphate mannosyltransferase
LRITVVIPTYNEAKNLAGLISALFELTALNLHILVVDDNSPDGTGQIASVMAEKHPGRISVICRPSRMGLGSAYIDGFSRALEADAEVIGQMDADFSHPPGKLIDLVDALETCDVALGSRYIPGGSLDKKWPVWRKGLSNFGNLYARTILRLPVKDATGGFRLWHRQTLESMPLGRVASKGYAFQVEMIFLAHRMGFKFREVPFYFADRQSGKSKMSFAIQVEAARRVWQMLYEYRDVHPQGTV